ncbi:hypothetical protein QTP88_008875 [Uroleucon formosanum]
MKLYSCSIVYARVPHASVLVPILTLVGTTDDVERRYYNEPAGKCAVELFGLTSFRIKIQTQLIIYDFEVNAVRGRGQRIWRLRNFKWIRTTNDGQTIECSKLYKNYVSKKYILSDKCFTGSLPYNELSFIAQCTKKHLSNKPKTANPSAGLSCYFLTPSQEPQALITFVYEKQRTNRIVGYSNGCVFVLSINTAKAKDVMFSHKHMNIIRVYSLFIKILNSNCIKLFMMYTFAFTISLHC